MAKKVVATLKKEGTSKVYVKAYKLVINPKTGAYAYKAAIMAADDVNEFFAKKD